MARRGWWLVLASAAALALVSLATDVTTTRQLAGEADTLLAVRSTASRLANAGVVWAGLPVLSGWLVRRPGQAAAAGVLAGLLALGLHYALGRLLGLYQPDVWVQNRHWFVAAVVAGPLLGLVGAAARRPDRWGLLARLVVPVGAVLEPFYRGMLSTSAVLPWPARLSSTVSGVALLAAGVAGGAAVLVRHRRRSSSPAADG